MRWARLVIMAALFTVFVGCISTGRDFRSSSFSWIRENKTTKDKVLATLGEPFRVGVDSGMTTWTYGYYKYRLGGSSDTKDLVIYFNKDGTVSSYTFSTSFEDEKEAWRGRNAP
jgi:hypothetical protein